MSIHSFPSEMDQLTSSVTCYLNIFWMMWNAPWMALQHLQWLLIEVMYINTSICKHSDVVCSRGMACCMLLWHDCQEHSCGWLLLFFYIIYLLFDDALITVLLWLLLVVLVSSSRGSVKNSMVVVGYLACQHEHSLCFAAFFWIYIKPLKAYSAPFIYLFY